MQFAIVYHVCTSNTLIKTEIQSNGDANVLTKPKRMTMNEIQTLIDHINVISDLQPNFNSFASSSDSSSSSASNPLNSTCATDYCNLLYTALVSS